EIGLAQVIFESGMNATKRSKADAVGFCQWLQKNWKRLNHFSPTPIEGRNQTTQAPYCAAYLSVLATKYGSFIPALSGRKYEDVYRSYGPRSYLYAEMVFGNSFNVRNLIASMPQEAIYAMRT